MNETIKTIHARRSIRAFSDEPIDQKTIDLILGCGRRAPNAWNHQTFEFIAVTNRPLLDRLADLTARYLGGVREDHNFFGAPLVILITDLRENFMRLADAGCAMENMFLAAQSLNLGSVWINQFATISNKLEVIRTLEEIGVTEDRVITSVGAFGHPAAGPREKELISQVRYLK
ncbi:MAG TPA: nitroreductase [Candidatus Pygmaiobacter gallistercoris]|nr:nitroreductase [Candidatus Pygmaiobacter gallistercoris]